MVRRKEENQKQINLNFMENPESGKLALNMNLLTIKGNEYLGKL